MHKVVSYRGASLAQTVRYLTAPRRSLTLQKQLFSAELNIAYRSPLLCFPHGYLFMMKISGMLQVKAALTAGRRTPAGNSATRTPIA